MVRTGRPPRTTIRRRIGRWIDTSAPTTLLAVAALLAIAAR